MVIKPDQLPMWADSDQVDPISGSNNVLTPPPEKQMYGWARLDYPVRNWMNWLGRYAYRWIAWLDQQEQQAVVSNGNGVGLFVTPDALITLTAVDTTNTSNFIYAVGYKAAGSVPVLNVIQNNVLTLGVGTISGNQPISGGSASNLVVYAQSKIIP